MRKLFVILGICGCGGDAVTMMMAPPDMAQSPVERGAYLVEHVSDCVGCHTPKGADGKPDRARLLSGKLFADLAPGDDSQGEIYAPNLTPHATGLAGWSDAEIKHAFLDGVAKDGHGLFPLMPYAVLHNLDAADADAIVAYLRSVPPVDNQVPPIQILPITVDTPTPLLDVADLPQTTLGAGDAKRAQADRGRYLAGMADGCITCHTPIAFGGVPIDTVRLFAGNRGFDAAGEGLPTPPYPPTIYSANLTPAATGLGGWTAEEIATAVRTGVDKYGKKLCGPMPFDAFAGLTDEDALAIGVYLTTIAPNDSGAIALCTLP
jgi:mono/diheme cytochrome c family protein